MVSNLTLLSFHSIQMLSIPQLLTASLTFIVKQYGSFSFILFFLLPSCPWSCHTINSSTHDNTTELRHISVSNTNTSSLSLSKSSMWDHWIGAVSRVTQIPVWTPCLREKWDRGEKMQHVIGDERWKDLSCGLRKELRKWAIAFHAFQ